MRIVICLAALLLTAAPAWAACEAPAATSGRFAVEVDGRSRAFVVRMPRAAAGTPAPVVFVFHPYGMNASYMQARAPVPRAWPEAVVVYPDGSGVPPSWQTRPGERGDADVHFFDAMRAWLGDHACVDNAHVFVMGYSNGAALTFTLVCERASAIAGAAIVSGRLGCTPRTAIPIVIRHGTHDATIGYGEGVGASQAFSNANGCQAPPKTSMPGCFEAAGCASARVRLCTDEGGHEYVAPFTAEAVRFLQSIR
jgi:polyhydroxybutyrate depolymerase